MSIRLEEAAVGWPSLTYKIYFYYWPNFICKILSRAVLFRASSLSMVSMATMKTVMRLLLLLTMTMMSMTETPHRNAGGEFGQLQDRVRPQGVAMDSSPEP